MRRLQQITCTDAFPTLLLPLSSSQRPHGKVPKPAEGLKLTSLLLSVSWPFLLLCILIFDTLEPSFQTSPSSHSRIRSCLLLLTNLVSDLLPTDSDGSPVLHNSRHPNPTSSSTTFLLLLFFLPLNFALKLDIYWRLPFKLLAF